MPAAAWTVLSSAAAIGAGGWLWGAAAVIRGLAAGSVGTALPLAVTILPTVVALPALVIGLAGLASPRPAGGLAGLFQLRLARAGVPWLADGCLVAAALFLITWVTVLSAGYRGASGGAGAFATDLTGLLAALVVLGGILRLAARAGWQALAPCAALLLATAGDALSVGARGGGAFPGW